MRRFLLTGCIHILALSQAHLASAQSPQQKLQQNVASIYFKKGLKWASATAFILDNGVLVTCAHNLRWLGGNVTRLEITLRDSVPGAKVERLNLPADYINRNTVTNADFIYLQGRRHRNARAKYDYAFIKLSDAMMQPLRAGLTAVTVADKLPVLTDTLYSLGYPMGILTYQAFGPGKWALAQERVEAPTAPPTRVWYSTAKSKVGASGSPLFQVQGGVITLVGVHTDGAEEKPYSPGDETTGVASWSKFYEAYKAALLKTGQ
ncbi:trypsin-like serine peptidase [Hymenobacter monticola]|uniref:Serine protease n=1 Tax=Hymenobacter monticola TaxID=1705399 RepID=A0ABY4BC58_9BACT|nr:serine protease [Hymenobacter monticola]UOE36717.1 serine protease [Hymenobacter monticola]